MNQTIAIAVQQHDGSLIAVGCLWDRPEQPAAILPAKFPTAAALNHFINYCSKATPPRRYPDFCEFLEHGRTDFTATHLFIQADGIWYGTVDDNPCGLLRLSK